MLWFKHKKFLSSKFMICVESKNFVKINNSHFVKKLRLKMKAKTH